MNDQPPENPVEKPSGQPAIVVMAMPADTNSAGDIFGGWIMAQMDVAGAVAAVERAHGRVVTVAADSMVFHAPVAVGNVVAFYSTVEHVGRTSLRVRIAAWARGLNGAERHVTSGLFTYVKVGPDRRPVPVDA